MLGRRAAKRRRLNQGLRGVSKASDVDPFGSATGFRDATGFRGAIGVRAAPWVGGATGLRVAVVDYGAGNLVSIEQALTTVGARVAIARDAGALQEADALVVPGVGAAAPAMDRLSRAGLVDPILRWIAVGRPFLGICLGLQLLFEASDEDG